VPNNNGTEWDFRTGWRWLLPIQDVGRVRLYGFTNEEERFWREVLPAPEWKADGQPADALLVDGVRCGVQSMPSLGDITAAQMVCMLVSRAQAKRWRRVLYETFPKVREYGLLPSHNPRIVVPLSTARHALVALNLHRPGRWVARFGLMLARALVCVGNFELLRGRTLLIATRSSDFIPNGAVHAELPERFGQHAMDCALYLGTMDANRKTVVLPMGDLPPSTILKVAASPTARASLNNEAAALSALSQSPLSAFVPRLVGLVSTDAALTLYQEYRIRHWRFGRAASETTIIRFLAAMSRIGRERREIDGHFVTGYFCHGDFVPWNLQPDGGGLFVFDWEHSVSWAPAFADAFQFIVAPALLVKREKDILNIEAHAKAFAARLADVGGLERAQIDHCWRHWLTSAAMRMPQLIPVLENT
jgi:hypothetical protein